MATLSERPERVEIKAAAHSALADVHVVHMEQHSPIERTTRAAESFRLDLSLTPSYPRAELCFADQWPSDRFETAGKLFLIPPGQQVRIRSDPGGVQTLIACQCRTELFRDLLEENFEWTEPRLKASSNITSDAIRHLLVSLGAEARHPGFASELMVEGYAMQIAAHLSRQLVDLKEASAGEQGLSPWRLRTIDERIEDVERAPTLSELARLLRLSVRQLSRGFRASRGVSIGRYIADKRAEKAKLLLGRGESVKAVAHRLGFGSSESFSTAFRRATGVTPKAFKHSVS
jgi:AraC family transcriptional regulator